MDNELEDFQLHLEQKKKGRRRRLIFGKLDIEVLI